MSEEDYVATYTTGGGIMGGKASSPVDPGEKAYLRSAEPTSYAQQGLSRTEVCLLGTQLVLGAVVLICSACLAGFQQKWLGKPSGLSGYLIFVSLFSMLCTSLLLFFPLCARKAHGQRSLRVTAFLQQARPAFVFRGVPTGIVLLTTLIQTISVGTSKGCKKHERDGATPKNGNRDAYLKALGGFCASKRATTVFLWFLLVTWGVVLVLFVMAWRADRNWGRHHAPNAVGPEPNNHFDQSNMIESGRDGRLGYAPTSPLASSSSNAQLGYHAEAASTAPEDLYAPTSPHPSFTMDPLAEPKYDQPEDEQAEMEYYRARYGTTTVDDPAPNHRSFDYASYLPMPPPHLY